MARVHARESPLPRARERHRGSSQDATLPHTRQDVANARHTHTRQHRRQKGPVKVKPAGESGRSGIHPFKFFKIVWKSTSYLSRAVNILWPFVPAAIAVRYTLPDQHVLIFSLSYLAMIPVANLLGFAGQELSRKMPHMAGVLVETTIASIVEIILFIVLLLKGQYYVIKAAILGSILATMLLCLGLCFFAAGMRHDEPTFDGAISEVGSGLLLIAGLGLAVPTIFYTSLKSVAGDTIDVTLAEVASKTTNISRIVAILLVVAYGAFVWFQMRTHHGLYDAVFEHDEKRDRDGHKDLAKEKLTLTECIIALAISVALVSIIAITLVHEIPAIVLKGGVSDPFMGLILVPLVEKAAEHLTAIDEAWDDQINFALAHCIGSTIQTAMLNAPLVVIAGWGLGLPMDFNFEIFDIVLIILAIITVGNFLRDEKSNYLEGLLCIIVYVAIAVAAFFYPTPIVAYEHALHEFGGGH
ncbi:Ca2+ transporter [Microdochium bolleyi]|uniref:Vacuolar calcium ion transporter n=1 Tax=Microdochium bolleyi TaxID=196109 RepID=A0A136IMW3_9PEZI|nr:Ca2+ transporter [Microdochium bolleyi]